MVGLKGNDLGGLFGYPMVVLELDYIMVNFYFLKKVTMALLEEDVYQPLNATLVFFG